MVDLTAPPRDPVFAGCVGKPRKRSRWHASGAEAHDVVAAQLIECAQQVMLITQPAFLFCDDGRTVAVGAYAERINPFGAASDVGVPNRTPDLRLFRRGDK
jgi:hypothetical protein